MLMRVMMPLLCVISVLAGILYDRPGIMIASGIFCVLSIGMSFADRWGLFRHGDCPRCREPLVFHRPRLGQIYRCAVCQTEFSPLGWKEAVAGGGKTDVPIPERPAADPDEDAEVSPPVSDLNH